jgi:hypothetical protein
MDQQHLMKDLKTQKESIKRVNFQIRMRENKRQKVQKIMAVPEDQVEISKTKGVAKRS